MSGINEDIYQIKAINKCQFEVIINHITRETANILRKIFMSHIPTMRINIAIWEYNTSLMVDEVILQRITTIPIKTDINSFSLQQNCHCISSEAYGCAKCGEWLEIDVTATKNEQIVRSGDLIPVSNRIEVVNKKIKLVVLRRGDMIKARCFAKIGFGSENSTYSPITTITFNEISTNRFRFIIEPKGPDMTIEQIIDAGFKRLPLYSKLYKNFKISPDIERLTLSNKSNDQSLAQRTIEEEEDDSNALFQMRDNEMD